MVRSIQEIRKTYEDAKLERILDKIYEEVRDARYKAFLSADNEMITKLSKKGFEIIQDNIGVIVSWKNAEAGTLAYKYKKLSDEYFDEKVKKLESKIEGKIIAAENYGLDSITVELWEDKDIISKTIENLKSAGYKTRLDGHQFFAYCKLVISWA